MVWIVRDELDAGRAGEPRADVGRESTRVVDLDFEVGVIVAARADAYRTRPADVTRETDEPAVEEPRRRLAAPAATNS